MGLLGAGGGFGEDDREIILIVLNLDYANYLMGYDSPPAIKCHLLQLTPRFPFSRDCFTLFAVTIFCARRVFRLQEQPLFNPEG